MLAVVSFVGCLTRRVKDDVGKTKGQTRREKARAARQNLKLFFSHQTLAPHSLLALLFKGTNPIEVAHPLHGGFGTPPLPFSYCSVFLVSVSMYVSFLHYI